MEPGLTRGGDDALRTQDHTVLAAIKCQKDLAKLLYAIRASRFGTKATKNLVGVVVVVMLTVMVVATALALLIVIVVVMLTVVVVAAALALLTVVVVVMLAVMVVAAALALLIMIMVVMLTAVVVATALTFLVVIVVVMLTVVVVTAALALLIMIVVVAMMLTVMVVATALALLVVIVVVMVVVVRFLHQLGKNGVKGIRACGGRKDLRAVQLIPGGSNDHGVGIVLAQEGDGRGNGSLAHITRTRKDDCPRVLDLIVKKLTKVLHIHTALLGINHHGSTAKRSIGKLQPLHRADHVAELANARRLDQDAVGGVIGHYLFKCAAKVTHKATANTPRVHLIDRNARLTQKAAVNADLTEFIFNEGELLARVSLGNQFFDQRGLPRTEKARKNINLGHSITSPFKDLLSYSGRRTRIG